MAYTNFDITLTAEEPPDGGYNVVVSSATGTVNGSFSLAAVRVLADELRQALQEGRVAQSLAEGAGAALFEQLLSGEVRDLYRDSLSATRDADSGLRLRLYTQIPALVALPWEYLYEQRLQRWLALYPHTSLVRALPVPGGAVPVVQGEVRLFALLSDPLELPALDVEREWEMLQSATDHAALDLTRVEATYPALLAALRQQPHILHFVGHGGFDGTQGSLLLKDAEGHAQPLAAPDLATLLDSHPTLRLVVLNACHGAESSTASAFAGVAQALVQRGVPAVIAMQAPISDAHAFAFSQTLYQALAEGVPLERALGEARKQLHEAKEYTWGIPTLYSQSPDLFTLTPLTTAQKAERLFQRAERVDAPDRRRALLQQVLALEPTHAGATQALERVAKGTEAARLYAEAELAYGAMQWRGAYRLLEQVERLLPNFKQTRSLLAEVKGQLDEPAAPASQVPPRWEELQPILNALKEGRLVPFIGWGVSRFGRPAADAWVPGESLPAPEELARELARSLGDSDSAAMSLLQVAQLTTLTEGESVLYERLSDLYHEAVSPTLFHRLLAEVVVRLRSKGYPTNHERRLVLFSAAFDDLLERAFEEAGQPCHLFAYRRRYRDMDGVEHAGCFLHVAPTGEVVEIPPKEANRYNGHDSDRHPVIVKLVGRRATPDPECLVVTEDQFLEYLPSQVIGDLLPATLLTEVKRRSFLFLGYDVAEWHMRLVWQRIRVGTSRLHDKGWAVVSRASAMERELWRSQDVVPIVAPTEQLIAALNEWLNDLEALP